MSRCRKTLGPLVRDHRGNFFCFLGFDENRPGGEFKNIFHADFLVVMRGEYSFGREICKESALGIKKRMGSRDTYKGGVWSKFHIPGMDTDN